VGRRGNKNLGDGARKDENSFHILAKKEDLDETQEGKNQGIEKEQPNQSNTEAK
jgi:hypothetical protein